nr:hypothetical protein BaRGS_003850 [Batillaria attramentaria]
MNDSTPVSIKRARPPEFSQSRPAAYSSGVPPRSWVESTEGSEAWAEDGDEDDGGCGTLPADIEFLLDSSGSVGQSNFNKVKDFVKKFSRSFDIGPNAVQIGVSTFDTHPRNEFWLNQHNTNASLINAIDHISYHAGNTHTDEALQFVRQNAFTKVSLVIPFKTHLFTALSQ